MPGYLLTGVNLSFKVALTFGMVISLPLMFANCIEEENDLASQDCTSGCAEIKGRLTTDNGDRGIGNTRLQVKWINRRYLAGGVVRTKAETRANDGGEFDFRFKIREDELNEGYFVVEYFVDPDKYLIFGENDFSVSELKANSSVTVNYLIPKKAFVRCRILNPDQMKPDDYFASQFGSKMGYDGGCCSGAVGTWSSPPLNPVEVAGNQPLYIRTSRRKDGVKKNRYDFYPSGGDIRFHRTKSFDAYRVDRQ